jgi:hypothetical protein
VTPDQLIPPWAWSIHDWNTRKYEVYDWAGTRVQKMVRREFPATTEIIDVGPCYGKYRVLLPEYPDMDACEIWGRSVAVEGLADIYRTVFTADICDLVQTAGWKGYDIAILGDVLEHIERPRACELVTRLLETCREVIVIVQYLYVQGPEHGNPYQAHRQEDLTFELMTEHYPGLALMEIEFRGDEPYKGIYRRKT